MYDALDALDDECYSAAVVSYSVLVDWRKALVKRYSNIAAYHQGMVSLVFNSNDADQTRTLRISSQSARGAGTHAKPCPWCTR